MEVVHRTCLYCVSLSLLARQPPHPSFFFFGQPTSSCQRARNPYWQSGCEPVGHFRFCPEACRGGRGRARAQRREKREERRERRGKKNRSVCPQAVRGKRKKPRLHSREVVFSKKNQRGGEEREREKERLVSNAPGPGVSKEVGGPGRESASGTATKDGRSEQGRAERSRGSEHKLGSTQKTQLPREERGGRTRPEIEIVSGW